MAVTGHRALATTQSLACARNAKQPPDLWRSPVARRQSCATATTLCVAGGPPTCDWKVKVPFT